MYRMQESTHPRGLIKIAIIQATALVAFVIGIDQIAKQWAIASKPSWGISNLIESVHHQNYGIIANIPIPQWITILATLAIIVYITMQFLKEKNTSIHFILAYGLLIGGALGNLIDRIYLGYVFDWILIFGRSAINIADISITIGIIFYLIGLKKGIGRF